MVSCGCCLSSSSTEAVNVKHCYFVHTELCSRHSSKNYAWRVKWLWYGHVLSEAIFGRKFVPFLNLFNLICVDFENNLKLFRNKVEFFWKV